MHVKKLSDYTPTNYSIDKTQLEFDIQDDHVIVKSKLLFSHREGSERVISLDGQNLEIQSLSINGEPIEDYKYSDDKLEFKTDLDNFEFQSTVKIDPYNNTSCEGLYKSGNILCTQNEAEGFRRITFFYDRPDCMSVFETIIKADQKKFPYLLANGNCIDENIDKGRKTVTWADPFKKPTYLFALVAGDLALVKDKFITKSKKEVSLEFFVDHGNEDKCTHAVESLKNAMRWDEDVFGLEYDLDIYMVVAVDSFNMGAMENKGLNIFNSQYVLAKKETATDANFQGVEGVIGHEYFHNWTGNRVTCRDWFQLTLKEGLTVFRDQEFSSDMLSRSVKRIEDVKSLRGRQFPEDASGLSHPIKPKEYSEINNFYTATVYEKGAEVIRMIYTIIGKDNFRAGMDLYFNRHDGEAVTTEDFVAAMSDASGVNLDHFKVWYDQNGTPEVKVQKEYNQSDKTLKLKLSQCSKLNNKNFDCLYIPVKIAVFSMGEKVYDKLCIFDKVEMDLIIENISDDFVVSFNRDFTAPIKVDLPLTPSERLKQFSIDDDAFNKYESISLFNRYIINEYIYGNDCDLREYLEVFKNVLNDESIESALKAYLLESPSYLDILNEQSQMKVPETFDACKKLKFEIARSLKEELKVTYDKLNSVKEFDLSSQSMGDRSLKNLCFDYLSCLDENELLAKEHFAKSTNMTDELSGLKSLYYSYGDKESLETFYNKWSQETLVIQKWFALQASNPRITVRELAELELNPRFDIKVPNIARAVFGSFMRNNLVVSLTEEGIEYSVSKILAIDSFNPQIAAGLAKSYNYVTRLPKSQKALITSHLNKLSQGNTSAELKEVIQNIINEK